ncbi:MAG: EamA family transporter [Mycolicibacterium sp.]|nr:EamA family transporter [Mycolicibacterium sp.]
MTGILFALLSAAGYGVSDFVGGIASRRVAALRVVLVSYPIAMVLLTVLAVVFGGTVTTPAVVWGALCGISQAFGVWWFYAALAAGPISVVSPLTAILVAGVPVGVGVALGERPSVVAYAGIVVALVAVVLVSREAEGEVDRPHRFTKQVAWMTVGSGLAFGLNFVLIDQAPVEARLWPLVFARVSASVLVILIALASANLVVPRGVPLKLALAAGVLDTIANVAMLLALQVSLLSLTGVLISLYPAGTVALAMLVLKERVTRLQAVGMVLALAAVAMIAAG